MAKLGTKYDKGDKQGMTAAKAFSAPPENIKIVTGHNYRKVDPERVEMFKQMYLDGKDVPPVLVALGDNDELELVDGEHRVRAAVLFRTMHTSSFVVNSLHIESLILFKLLI